jgi:hypothetical protein
MELDRRVMLEQTGIAALTFVLAGSEVAMTPREARAANLPHRTLGPAEAKTLDALGETLVPGAAAAGIANFIDQQISIEPAQALLMIKYLDVPPPFARFYTDGLAGLDAAARAQNGAGFADLTVTQRSAIVRALGSPAGLAAWSAPIPARLFYFALRSDAVDVVYGTVDGFAKLGIPYVPHIAPVRTW